MKKLYFELYLKITTLKKNHIVLLNAYKIKSLTGLIPDDNRIINQVADCNKKGIPLQPIIVNFSETEWDLFEKEIKSKVFNLKGFPAELFFRNIPIVFLNKPE